VRVEDDRDEVLATVTGADLGDLSGRHGQVIDSLE